MMKIGNLRVTLSCELLKAQLNMRNSKKSMLGLEYYHSYSLMTYYVSVYAMPNTKKTQGSNVQFVQ